jgi:hypothetical protein
MEEQVTKFDRGDGAKVGGEVECTGAGERAFEPGSYRSFLKIGLNVKIKHVKPGSDRCLHLELHA